MLDPHPPKRILIVDSNPAIHADFRKILNTNLKNSKKISEDIQQVYLIDSAYEGEQAFHCVRNAVANHYLYTVIFVDLCLIFGWDGMTTIQRIWEVDPDVQIVVCIASSAYSWKSVAEKLQHLDHYLIINKPFDVSELRQLVFYLSRKQDTHVLIQKKIAALREKIHYQSTHDQLTGMANRQLLSEYISRAMSEADPMKLWVGIALFSFDQLDEINTVFGYATGDGLLALIIEKLKSNCSGMDTLIRFDSHEFIVLFTIEASEEKLNAKINHLLEGFSKPFKFDHQSMMISMHIGTAVYPRDGHDSAALIKKAKIALAYAKTQGQEPIQIYNKVHHEVALRHAELVISLRDAIANKQFILQYQPLVQADSSQILGVEALIRWQHPQFGLLYPQEFIPLAEEMGLMSAIGEWVLKTACTTVKKWQETLCPGLVIAVNISAYQLRDHFDRLVQNILKKVGLEPQYLELEIIANPLLMQGPDHLRQIRTLQELGVHFSLDNFGVGYANLNYLHYFPFEKLKIDKTFIKNIKAGSKKNYEIESIIHLANQLGIKVVAEGVETPEQVEFLFNHHGDQMQGFYFSPPLDEEACSVLLKNKHTIVQKGMNHAFIK